MESSGECRGCQRNIKFAVKQARLCRTCYNKTYLTSQKRREYYKNKKKRRETTSSVEPAIDVHQHRHGKSIKKEEEEGLGNRSPPPLPDNLGQDPVAAHLYLLSYQSQSHHTRSCSDCVPQAGLFAASSSASPAALSLAALAHASQHHASSSPASPLTSGSTNGGSSSHHLSSATTSSSSPCSPASSPPMPMAAYPQQLHVQYQVAHHSVSPATASSTPSGTPYGSPPTPGPVLFQDLLQQMSYYAAMAPMLGLAPPVAMPTEMFATASTTSSFSASSSSSTACGLPSLSAFFLPTSSTNSLAIPTPRYPPSAPQPRSCQQCHSPAASAHRFVDAPEPTWLCDGCLADRRHGAQPATRSPAIKNLLN